LIWCLCTEIQVGSSLNSVLNETERCKQTFKVFSLWGFISDIQSHDPFL